MPCGIEDGQGIISVPSNTFKKMSILFSVPLF